MSGSRDPEVLEAAKVLSMLGTNPRRELIWEPPLTPHTFEPESPIRGQSSITVVQTPPRPAQSPALVESTSPAEQPSPAQAGTDLGDVYSMRAFVLQALLAPPAGDWVRVRDVRAYFHNKYPEVSLLSGTMNNVSSNISATLKAALKKGLVERREGIGEYGEYGWRIKEGERQRAIYMIWEKKPPGLPRGRPRLGAGRARNVRDRGRVDQLRADPFRAWQGPSSASLRPAAPGPAVEPASHHEPASSGPASPTPALTMQARAAARAAPGTAKPN